LARKASLIITQPIKTHYRDLPLGTNEILNHASSGCTVIRFQALHFDAFYPFQCNVLGSDRIGVCAPRTAYHDLRIVCAAAASLNARTTVRWLNSYRPDEDALRKCAESAASLVRERDRTTDVSLSNWVFPEAGNPRTFFTINHPTRFVLEKIVSNVHTLLGLTQPVYTDDREPLGRYRAPLEQPVMNALGLRVQPQADWIINGRTVSLSRIVRRQLDWYQRHPDVVRAAVAAQAERIRAFDLLPRASCEGDRASRRRLARSSPSDRLPVGVRGVLSELKTGS
jgi:hypothetical protein